MAKMFNKLPLFIFASSLILLSGCASERPCSQANVNAALKNSETHLICTASLSDNKYIAFLQANGAGFVREQNRLILTVPSDKLFEASSATFRDGSAPYLNSMANILKSYQKEEIDIFANTDPISGEEFNQQLSENQAAQVAGFLWSNGISNAKTRRVYFKGNGELEPIATNEKLAGMTKNRNIMIVVQPMKSKPILNKPKRPAPAYKKTYRKAYQKII